VQQARRAVGDLWAGLAAARLDETVAPPARAQLAAVEAAVRAPEPNRSRVADALRQFTRLLVASGSLSAALVGPLQTLADWLGTLGEPIRQALAALG
jgi:hypothetical protein